MFYIQENINKKNIFLEYFIFCKMVYKIIKKKKKKTKKTKKILIRKYNQSIFKSNSNNINNKKKNRNHAHSHAYSLEDTHFNYKKKKKKKIIPLSGSHLLYPNSYD